MLERLAGHIKDCFGRAADARRCAERAATQPDRAEWSNDGYIWPAAINLQRASSVSWSTVVMPENHYRLGGSSDPPDETRGGRSLPEFLV